MFSKLQRFLSDAAMPLNLEVEEALRTEVTACRRALDAAKALDSEDDLEAPKTYDDLMREALPDGWEEDEANENSRMFIEKMDITDPDNPSYVGYVSLASDMKQMSNMDVLLASYALATNHIPSHYLSEATECMVIFEASYKEEKTPPMLELKAMRGMYDEALGSLAKMRQELLATSTEKLRNETIGIDRMKINDCLSNNRHLDDPELLLIMEKRRPSYIPQDVFTTLIEDMAPYIRFENHDATASTMLNDALEKYAPREREKLTQALERQAESANILDVHETAIKSGKRCLERMIKEIGFYRLEDSGPGGGMVK